MNSEDKPKKRNRFPDRVTLNAEILPLVDSWRKQLVARVKGIRISRSDVVNWVIKQHPEQLTAVEVREYEKAHFDEVKYLEWAVQQAKQARSAGQKVELGTILASLKGSTKVERRDKGARTLRSKTKEPQRKEVFQSEGPQTATGRQNDPSLGLVRQ